LKEREEGRGRNDNSTRKGWESNEGEQKMTRHKNNNENG
jgi:hypothetical protein